MHTRITIDSSGKVNRRASKFVVDAETFLSDKDRSDGYMRERLLDAMQYPTIVLVPTEVRGVGRPGCDAAPPSGKVRRNCRMAGSRAPLPLHSRSTTSRWSNRAYECCSALPTRSGSRSISTSFVSDSGSHRSQNSAIRVRKETLWSLLCRPQC
jgi:hypothetical protein